MEKIALDFQGVFIRHVLVCICIVLSISILDTVVPATRIESCVIVGLDPSILGIGFPSYDKPVQLELIILRSSLGNLTESGTASWGHILCVCVYIVYTNSVSKHFK